MKSKFDVRTEDLSSSICVLERNGNSEVDDDSSEDDVDVSLHARRRMNYVRGPTGMHAPTRTHARTHSTHAHFHVSEPFRQLMKERQTQFEVVLFAFAGITRTAEEEGASVQN